MRLWAVAASAAALMLCQAPAGAQPATGGPDSIQTFVAVGGPPRAGEMRSAGTAGDASKWLTPADIPDSVRAAAQGKSAGPRYQIVLAQVGLDFDVGVDDSVSNCRARHGDVELVPKLCALILERGRFQHALTDDGIPRPGVASVVVQYSLSGPGGHVGLPPAPMAVSTWPVRDHGYKVAVAKEPEWKRFSGVRNGRTTAISLSFRDGAVAGCSVIRSSGEAALDAATCAAARTGSYTLEPGRPYQRLPMIVSWQRDRARIKVPVQPHWHRAEPLQAADLVVRGVPGATRGEAWLDITAIGAVTGCRVSRSAGSDAADLAMCKTLRSAIFKPARDVFDEPFATGYSAEVRFE